MKKAQKIAIISLFLLLSSTIGIQAQEKKSEQKIQTKASEEKSEQVPPKQVLIASFADIIEDLLPTVVNISTAQEIKTNNTIDENFLGEFPRTPIFEDLKKQLDNQFNGAQRKKAISIGSGFIISKDGYIATNNHVINDSTDIDVSLQDGSKYKAKVIGIDKKTDLALLKINPTKDLKFVKFGDSNRARIGDWTIVIGNPYGFGGSVSVGIISARGRDIYSSQYDEYIQTDAAINKGNSGGPLFNSKGEVIGISTAIFSPSGGSVGIGFATPSSVASPIIKQLKDQGEVTRGWIGVSIQEINEELADSLKLDSKKGVFVTDIVKNGPADKAGISPSDVIIKFEDQEIDAIKTLPKTVSKFPAGKTAKIVVWRQGKLKTLKITVEKMHEEEVRKNDIKFNERKQQLKPAGQILGMNLAEIKSYVKNDKKEINVEGLIVLEINPKSEASNKGITVGDIILTANQIPLKSIDDLKNIIEESSKNNKKIFLLIKRNENSFAVVLSLK